MRHLSPLQPEGKPLEPLTYLSTTPDVNKQAESRKRLKASLLLMII